MRPYLALVTAFALLGTTLGAQSSAAIDPIVCSTDGTTVAAAAGVLQPKVNAVPRSFFDLRFSDDVPDEARASITYAAEIWQEFLISDIPIVVGIEWIDQNSETQLASAGPEVIFRDFSADAAPSTWYTPALAEAIAGRPLTDEDENDIAVVINSEIDWSFATTGTTPRRQISLATVVLHELGHGLGFFSSIDSVTENTASVGIADNSGSVFPIIYDLFLRDPEGRSVADSTIFPTPSPEVLEAVVNRLDFEGDNAVRENGGDPVPLFAPATFDVGSSVSHLDERAFPAGDEDALMSPSIAGGESIRTVGPVTLGILEDLGWNVVFDPSPVREIAAGELRPFPNPTINSFTLPIERLDDPSVAVLYAADGREARRQDISRYRGGKAVIDVNGLPPGMYTLFLPDAGRAYTGRVVVR